MPQYHLAEAEARFAELVWAAAPLSTAELVERCRQQFDWKPTTTYTVLRRLCDRGLLGKKGTTVRVLVSREEFYGQRSREFVQQAFAGSLPGFLAAFMGAQRLSARDVDELRALIDNYQEDDEEAREK